MNNSKFDADRSISGIYSMANRFISRLSLFFVISLFVVFSCLIIVRICELYNLLDIWSNNFENNLSFMETNGFFKLDEEDNPGGINSFVFDGEGNIIKSNIEGLQGLSISSSSLFLAVNEIADDEIYIGLHPDFFSVSQMVFIVVRSGSLHICLRYPPEQFLPARVVGADIVTIVRESRIIYSNIPEWIGAPLRFAPFRIIGGRGYLVGVLYISQMRQSKIIYYKNITTLLILSLCLLIVTIILFLALYCSALRILRDMQVLKREHLFITDIAGAMSENISRVMALTSEFKAYDEVLSNQAAVLKEINTGFIENRKILELFAGFTDSSRGLLRQLNQEAEKRVGIQEELISSQERVLDEKNGLISEIHHRVKNNLQIIAAILNLSGSGSDIPGIRDFIEAVAGRVHAIAFIHELLYSSRDVSWISAEEFIYSITSDKYDISNRKHILFDLTIDDIQLRLNELVPLGLIFNELLSSSMEHSSIETDDGTISISISTLGAGRARVTYSDSSIRPFEGLISAGPEGTGLVLVKELVKQLDGQLEVELKGGKAVFGFEFSLSAENHSEF